MKAIFFDLYETLVTHFDPNWVPPPQTVAQQLRIDEEHYAVHWPLLDKAWQTGLIPHYEDALVQLRSTVNGAPNADVLHEMVTRYRATYARPFATIEPDIVSMVVTIKRAGFLLGVITNASDLDAEPWPDSDLAPLFDVFIASHRVGALKPEQRIYDFACTQLGIRSDEAIFVGDGGSGELSGATHAGLTAYWATWFLDRWPEGMRPNGFHNDTWRQYEARSESSPFHRLTHPAQLLAIVT